MTAFNIATLAPANSIEGLGKQNPGKLTAKDSAIRNINAQIGLVDAKLEGKRTFWDTVVDGKRSYSGKGKSVGFYVKAGSAKLMFGETQEVGVSKAEFVETLVGIREAIKEGQLDEQLHAIDGKLDARKAKASATRATKRDPKA